MKAAVLTGLGNVSKLKVVNNEQPKIKKGKVLVRVKYCGVNHLDLLICSGKRPGPKYFPHILGSEIVGELENGELVAVYPWTFCGKCRPCLTHHENICDNGGTIGRTSAGGYAECAAVPEKNLVAIPAGLSLENVCALTLAGTTAVHLIDRAQVAKKSTVLVTGATGGVGTAVIQLLKDKRCEIIAATSSEQKKDKLKQLGVSRVVSMPNFPKGVQYVIDIVGGAVWSVAEETLVKNGTMVFCATSREELGQVNIGLAFSREVNILGSYGGTRDDLKTAIKLLKKGILKPVIDHIYPLSQVGKAHQRLEDQQVFGKILLQL